MKGTVTKMCRGGLLSSFILISYIALTTSMTLDLTELRNKVSKLKVNPRGNLWATGKLKITLLNDCFFVLFENAIFTESLHVSFNKDISWARRALWIVPL